MHLFFTFVFVQDGTQAWTYKELWTPIESLLPDRRNELLFGQTEDGLMLCWDLQTGKPAWHIPARLPELYTLITSAHYIASRGVIATMCVNGSIEGRSNQVRVDSHTMLILTVTRC